MEASQLHKPYYKISSDYIEKRPALQRILLDMDKATVNMNYDAFRRLEKKRAYRDYLTDTKKDRDRLKKRMPKMHASLVFWGILDTPPKRGTRARRELDKMTNSYFD